MRKTRPMGAPSSSSLALLSLGILLAHTGCGGGRNGGTGGSSGDASVTEGPNSLDVASADTGRDTNARDVLGNLCGTQRCAAPNTACCDNCNGGVSCSVIGPFCPAVQCPPLPVDAGTDANGGAIACGATTCNVQQACVHPPQGGTCLMPDAGQCPAGTSVISGCCLPPDNPSCVVIDRPCSGTTLSCSCFTVDPCDKNLTNACASSLIRGRDIQCHGA